MTHKKTKKILILNGSPRKIGNTSVILGLLKKALIKKRYSLDQIDLYAMNIKGCIHCNTCKKNKTQPGCVIRDDCNMVLEKICASDLVILASPIYCWSFSGCLSTTMDRFYSLFKREAGSLIKDKKIAGVFTSGGDQFDGMDLCVTGIKQLSAYGQAEYVGTLAIINCETPEKLSANRYLQQKITYFVNDL